MPKLYVMHHSTCARKALFTMIEKGASIETIEVQRDYLATPEYRALNPEGVVPTLVRDDGRALTESSVILRYIDEAFPGPSLQPDDPSDRADMTLWMKLVDDKFFIGLVTISSATFIRSLFRLPEQEPEFAAMLDAMVDYQSRRLREDAVRNGLASGYIPWGLSVLRGMLQRIEAAVSQKGWLVGDRMTLAECAITPIMLRLEEFGFAPAWEESLPATTAWWKKLSGRPSVRQLVELADRQLLGQLVGSIEPARGQFLDALRSAPLAA
ncbi:glutathione S-transferase family protein [Sphingomonas mali]|uniref:glutathione S-transferase family protein n=1 Tax=Sphingomonas mali TaxID=40682 RepID=UPI00082BE207|nr:glutathione S-transferase family protein [Sphingomonas mali]